MRISDNCSLLYQRDMQAQKSQREAPLSASLHPRLLHLILSVWRAHKTLHLYLCQFVLDRASDVVVPCWPEQVSSTRQLQLVSVELASKVGDVQRQPLL